MVDTADEALSILGHLAVSIGKNDGAIVHMLRSCSGASAVPRSRKRSRRRNPCSPVSHASGTGRPTPPNTEVRGGAGQGPVHVRLRKPERLSEQVIKASSRIWRPARRDLKLVNFCRSFTAGPQASRWQGRGGEFDTRAGGQLGALWHYGQRACALVFPIEDDERCDCCGGRRNIGRRCIAASYWRRRRFEGRGGIRVACTDARA